jgi:hypothetical protein
VRGLGGKEIGRWRLVRRARGRGAAQDAMARARPAASLRAYALPVAVQRSARRVMVAAPDRAFGLGFSYGSQGRGLMAGISYNRIREALDSIAGSGQRYGYSVQRVIDAEDTWLSTWSNDQVCVMVQAALAQPELDGRTLIDVHAGGAYAAAPAQGLFQGLCTATWRFDYGGPWARNMPGATVAYGWRSRLPSELFGESNHDDAFGFVLGMIDAFGMAAGTLAGELIPLYGGHPIRAGDPEAFRALLAGLLPPPENKAQRQD